MYIGKGLLKLIRQIIRLFGCILEKQIKKIVEIDEMQCRFMSGHGGTTVVIFILRPLQREVAPDF